MTGPSLPGAAVDFRHLPRLRALLEPSLRSLSEYFPANLILYRDRHRYCLVEGERPFLLGVTYDGEAHALPLCPLDAAAAGRLLDHADCLFPLAEDEAVRLAAQGDFRIDDREADADYVYDCAKLSRLDGASDKRAQATAFAALGPSLSPFAPDDARALLQTWLEEAGRGPNYADAHECAEAIVRHSDLELDGVTVRLEGRPMGFLLASPAYCGERVVHFAKGRRDVRGVYPWMFSRFAAIAGVERLNFEQDLGHPGLARAKQALAPIVKRRKFRLRKS